MGNLGLNFFARMAGELSQLDDDGVITPTEGAAVRDAVQEYFKNLQCVDTVPNEPVATVEDISARVADAKSKLAGTKPSWGLGDDSPEVKKSEATADRNNAVADKKLDDTNAEAENNLERAHKDAINVGYTATNNDNEAHDSTVDTENKADADNKNAQDATNQAQTTAKNNNQAAQNETGATEESAKNNNETAQNETKNAETTADQNNQAAKEATSSAETAHSQAQQVTTNAETKLSEAQAELTSAQNTSNNAKTDEEKAVAQANIDKANEAVQTAQQELNKAKEEEEQAQSALNSAKDNEAKVKKDGEKAVSDAKDNEAKVKTAGEKAVEDAKDNEAEVKTAGEKTVQDSKDNEAKVKTAGEKAVEDAKDNEAEVKTAGEEAVKDAKDNEVEVKTSGEEAVQDAEEDKEKVEEEGEEDIEKTKDDVYAENSELIEASIASMTSDKIVEAASSKQIDLASMNRDEKLTALMEKYPNVSDKKLAEIYFNQKQKIDERKKTTAQKCFNTDCTESLTNAINARYNQEITAGKKTKDASSELVNKPNGDINDNVPVQKTGNCWAHAGLNAIGSTKEGEKMLARHIKYDPEKGITAVHLQEAQNNKKGYNGTGVYTITDKELAEANKTTSANDGDVTAYTLAAKKYLNDIGQSDNGTLENDRMFQMVSGIKTTYADDVQDPDYIPIGISNMSSGTYGGKPCINKYNYNALKNGLSRGGMACCLNIAAKNGGGHAISVVGINPKTGNIIVQESNNSGKLNEMYTYSDKEGNKYKPFKFVGYVNGAPTYDMSEAVYHYFILDGSVYRWK